MRNRIIFFSGGKSSFTVAHHVKTMYPDDNILCYFTDTLWEDEDLFRFMYEGIEKLELPLLYHCVGINPLQIAVLEQFMPNSRVGLCSQRLKMEPAADYFFRGVEPKIVEHHNWDKLKRPINPIEEGFLENTTLYFGIGWDEAQREPKIKANWQPFDVDMPLMYEFYDNNEILLQYDIEEPALYKKRFIHNNCFSAKERFITIDGIKTFGEMVGQRTKVIGERSNWQDAEIKYFGKQQIVELIITKNGKERVIETTAGHRWFVRQNRKERVEIITSELRPGDNLWGMYQHTQGSIKPSAIGIAQGIVFGDGTYPRESWNNPATVTLCGEKVELLKYFPLQDVKEVKNIGLKVCDLPKSWKHYPDLSESKSFLLGWLIGYIATDGSVNKGSVYICSSKVEELEFVQKVCIKLGIAFNDITSKQRVGIDGKLSSVHAMSFVKSTFKKEWLIRERHKVAYGKDSKTRPSEWAVKEIRYTDRLEDVYCAVVPVGERFVLEGNVLTGNCRGRCVKAGQAHFRNLYEQDRATYIELMEQEAIISEYIRYVKQPQIKSGKCKDHLFDDVWAYATDGTKSPKLEKILRGSMILKHRAFGWEPKNNRPRREPYTFMKKQKNKQTFQYALYMLKGDIEAENPEIDEFDYGGCGCFIDDDSSQKCDLNALLNQKKKADAAETTEQRIEQMQVIFDGLVVQPKRKKAATQLQSKKKTESNTEQMSLL